MHGLQDLARQRRAAAAEDAVGRHVDAGFLFHRVLHFEITKHAQALGFQRSDGLCESKCVGLTRRSPQPPAG